MKWFALISLLLLVSVGCGSSVKPERSGEPTAEEIAAMIEIEKEIERLQKEKIAAGQKFIP